MLGAYCKFDICTAKGMFLGTLKRVIATFPRTSTKKHKGNAMIYKQVPIVANFGRFTDKSLAFLGYSAHNVPFKTPPDLHHDDQVEHSPSNMELL